MKRFALAFALALFFALPSLADLHNIDRVSAWESNSYRYKAGADGLIRVMVVGDGNTDLDLFIYDDNWNLIGSDRRHGDAGVVQFRVSAGTHYRIKVQNRGGRTNTFVLGYETPDRGTIGANYRSSVNGNSTTALDYRPTRSGWVRSTVVADEDVDLDLFVFADTHKLLDYDVRRAADGSIEFYAIAGRTYSIEIKNKSKTKTGYSLLTRQK